MSDQLNLTLKTRTIDLVWYQDLNEFIELHLGRPWNLAQNGEFGQDTIHSFEVYPDPLVTAKVQEWLDSPRCQCPGRLHQAGFAEDVDIYTTEILGELCNRGLLPEGELNVHVWW